MKKDNFIRRTFASKSFRYGTSSFIIIAVVLIMFVIINTTIPRLRIQWDLTPEGLYTLSNTSKDILGSIDDEIEIIGLLDDTKVSSASAFYNVIKLLEDYENYKNISVRYIDPDTNVGFMAELDPTGAMGLNLQNFVVRNTRTQNMKVVKYYDMFSTYVHGDTSFEITNTGSKIENAFTSAISYVSRESFTTVYFILGHNEYSYFDGYIKARDIMELNGYTVKSFDLRKDLAIPEDADILLMINPTIDYLDDEIKALETFMKNGGSLLVNIGSSGTAEEFKNIQKFLDFYNVQYNYDRIKEYDSNAYAASNQYHIFPKVLGAKSTLNTYRNITYLLTPNSRSIRLLNKSKSFLEVEPILRTTAMAKQEATISHYDSDSGMSYVGAEVINLATQARLVVLGSSDFIKDSFLMNNKAYEADANRFFIGIVNWLEGDYNQTTIEEKSYFINIISITASQVATVSTLLYILPGLILLVGGIVYLKRRHL